MGHAGQPDFDQIRSKSKQNTQAMCLADADPGDEVTMSVLVRRKLNGLRLPDSVQLLEVAGDDRQYLPRDEFAKAFGEFDADLEYVAQFGRQHGLTVLESCAQRRTVLLKGTAEQMLRFAQDETRMRLSAQAV